MRASFAALLVATTLTGCFADGSPPAVGINESPSPGGFSNTSVFPGDYEADGMPRPLEDGAYEPWAGQIVDLASQVDGANIRLGLIRPEVPAGHRVPVIVIASPYFAPIVATAEEDGDVPGGLLAESVDEELGRFDEWFVPHGYAVAAVALRGTAGSGGCFGYMSADEQADVDQAVTWLGTQEWSNGNVGMIGLSYDGSTPWMVAAKGNPHLKTIVPVSGVNDAFDLFFRNGTPQERGLWHPIYYWASSGMVGSAQGASSEGVADNASCTAHTEATAAATQAFYTGQRGAFYEVRNLRPGVEERYNGSIFLVLGLQDWNVVPGHQVPWVNELEAAGAVVKVLAGQWEHQYPPASGSDSRRDFAEILLHWWDYWLRADTDRDLGPRVQVQDDLGRWRDEQTWPPRDANRTRLYLTPDDLSSTPSNSKGFVVVGPSPSHFAVTPGPESQGLHDACLACVVLRSQPLERETLFSGMPLVQVDVTPLGPGGYVNAYLYAEDGGDARRVGWGSVDLRFGHGGPQPQPITPGDRKAIAVQMEPLDAVVVAGERLALVLAQGSYGVNEPERVTTWEVSPAVQPMQVHLGGDRAWLDLPEIERSSQAYFDAP